MSIKILDLELTQGCIVNKWIKCKRRDARNGTKDIN